MHTRLACKTKYNIFEETDEVVGLNHKKKRQIQKKNNEGTASAKLNFCALEPTYNQKFIWVTTISSKFTDDADI